MIHSRRVRLVSVSVRYGELIALNKFSLEIEPGEIVALLGPSGCGKSTALKAIAGLQPPNSGEIWFDDRRMNDVPAHLRQVGMVFQSYALFPHMTAHENVAFGLKMMKVPAAERAARIERGLKMVQMDGRADHYPDQLSGGQQQRVAIARTLAVEPSVLLLDEPLSALDRRLRDEMRVELSRLLKTIGITTIIVTHDQEEAFTLADRVAVMQNGLVEQIGAPQELYRRPASRFVANFLGQISYLGARVDSVETDTVRVILADGSVITGYPVGTMRPGDAVEIGVRPQDVLLQLVETQSRLPNAVPVRVAQKLYTGSTIEYRLENDGLSGLWSTGYDGQTLDLEEEQPCLAVIPKSCFVFSKLPS